MSDSTVDQKLDTYNGVVKKDRKPMTRWYLDSEGELYSTGSEGRTTHIMVHDHKALKRLAQEGFIWLHQRGLRDCPDRSPPDAKPAKTGIKRPRLTDEQKAARAIARGKAKAEARAAKKQELIEKKATLAKLSSLSARELEVIANAVVNA